MRRSTLSLAITLALGLTLAVPASAHDTSDGGAIRHLMMATFDKPESPLTVEPVVVQGDIAVAGWSQGEMGGRALLRRKGDAWTLTLCSGDALKEAASLTHFGLSQTEASAMAAAIAEAEAKLDPALVAKFSTFDGVVMMDEEGHHPPVHGGGHKPHS
ncbi:copper uptake system-associated protein [Aquibium microcysteis]|uniref:copper uptake system-associated protein n=1 Tax=Aquibium microcysteis TaxID=675281 RepID=UPI00165D0F82|nr:copper uptake system-associated protein [Aquibium microcysteis]